MTTIGYRLILHLVVPDLECHATTTTWGTSACSSTQNNHVIHLIIYCNYSFTSNRVQCILLVHIACSVNTIPPSNIIQLVLLSINMLVFFSVSGHDFLPRSFYWFEVIVIDLLLNSITYVFIFWFSLKASLLQPPFDGAFNLSSKPKIYV